MLKSGTVVFDRIQELSDCTIRKYAPSYESLEPSSVHASGVEIVKVSRLIQRQVDS